MNEQKCPNCGGELKREARPFDLVYRTAVREVLASADWCQSCDEGVFSAEDMRVTDTALNELKAEFHDVLSPDEIKKARKTLGLSKSEANELLGLAGRSFSKYESGTIAPSRSTSRLIEVVANVPAAREYLSQLQLQKP